MKLCDLTQFYSPRSGGVKRYVHEKIRYIQAQTTDEHVLIIPGEKTEMIEAERSRIYSIASPLLSRTSRYRALLNLRAIEEVLEREKPHLIESGDPYQVAWKAIASGAALRIPVVGFYHSHFPEAYLRTTSRFLGRTATEFVMDLARRYVAQIYNRFEATLVPSARLGRVLTEWGVRNVHPVDLGVDTDVFRPQPEDAAGTRESLGISAGCRLLLYVGRLAQEKNTQTLFAAFDLLVRREPGRYHLLIVGDGLQRGTLRGLQERTGAVTWQPYCTDSGELALFYRAADLLVHPSVQETFGLTALESQACGTPVVGIRGSYMDRIIFGGQKHWAAENSSGALADAVASAAAANDLQAAGQVVAKEVREQYAWPVVFKKLFRLYDEVRVGYRAG
ncbi:MAG: glycosyltransferase [Verrucomicrobiota bacterium]|nr:glycosyltransferase [Verrucomicrobiota bacterium]